MLSRFPAHLRQLLMLVILAPLSFASAAQEEELLDPAVAFVVSGQVLSADMLRVQFDIAPEYYLYRHAFKFKADDDSLRLGTPNIPAGEKKEDEWFGEVETYRDLIQIDIPYSYSGSGSFFVEVGHQGCADLGVCFPPQKQLLQFNPASATGAATVSAATHVTQESDVDNMAEQDRIAASLATDNILLTLLVFFGLGLLLAFTPCVFPMIPILSGIIIGQGDSITTRKAFFLSLTYVLAMAFTYTIVGIIVGLSGENIQALFQNPWVISAFAAIFVLLSFSMFGFYELQMPSSIQSKLTAISNNQESGSFIGAGIMGFLSALIVGPCVTAPLIGALIYIAETGDAVLGGSALFSLSLGMGAPLLVIGTSAGKLMPKAGSWMDAVKAFFGVALLALAIWLLDRIVSSNTVMLLSAILAITTAIYMGALEPLRENRSGWFALWKGLGLILLLYGVLLIIGAAVGGGSMLKPLQGFRTAGAAVTSTSHAEHFKQIKGLDGLEAALEDAMINNQPVMFDLYADWCVSCKEMEAFTFTDPQVQQSMNEFMLIQTDVTKNDAQDKALLKSIGVFGPPAIIFYDRNGEEIKGQRVVGYMNAEKFNQRLQQVLKKSF